MFSPATFYLLVKKTSVGACARATVGAHLHSYVLCNVNLFIIEIVLLLDNDFSASMTSDFSPF